MSPRSARAVEAEKDDEDERSPMDKTLDNRESGDEASILKEHQSHNMERPQVIVKTAFNNFSMASSGRLRRKSAHQVYVQAKALQGGAPIEGEIWPILTPASPTSPVRFPDVPYPASRWVSVEDLRRSGSPYGQAEHVEDVASAGTKAGRAEKEGGRRKSSYSFTGLAGRIQAGAVAAISPPPMPSPFVPPLSVPSAEGPLIATASTVAHDEVPPPLPPRPRRSLSEVKERRTSDSHGEEKGTDCRHGID
ncbi:hypothetical protein LTR53_003556 [Teratosphaeriaceae sp. CCFEE 6253]|nr:hypothetical protein LTR53_003556 [Teratosphaeriaceae sp. CCFEE 6253]